MAPNDLDTDIEAKLRRLGFDGSPGKSKRTTLVIAIDFGTTYTGVAYAHTHQTQGPVAKWTLSEIRDRIYPVKDWPNRDVQYPDKVRTALAYSNGAVIAWGSSVTPEHQTQVSLFKLGLQEDLQEYYSGISVLGGYLNDPNWSHPDLPGKNAVDFTSDFLKAVRQYVLETPLKKQFGARFLLGQSIDYVITVPAIWSDRAKELACIAAARAGMP